MPEFTPAHSLIVVDDPSRRFTYRVLRSLKIGDQLDVLTAQCEHLPAVNYRLAAYLPPCVRHPYQDEFLFAVCLHDAVQRAFATSPQGSVADYCDALVDRAALVLRYDIADTRGRWDPLHGPTLREWYQTSDGRPPIDPIPLPRLSLTQFREALQRRLLCAHMHRFLTDLRDEVEAA